MKVSMKFFLSLAAVSLAVVPSVFAEHSNDSSNSNYSNNQVTYVYANVIDVKPIKRYVTVSRPERVCEEVEYRPRRRSRHNSSNGTIAGGLLGGVIGRQFGGGKGRDAATIAGVLIGSAIGHDNEVNDQRRRSNNRYQTQTRRECSTRYHRSQEERIDGYKVRYKYQGETFTTRTRYEPGKQIRLAVNVRPLDDNYESQNDGYSDDGYSEDDDSYDRYAQDKYNSRDRD